jgi:hypothetical protein
MPSHQAGSTSASDARRQRHAHRPAAQPHAYAAADHFPEQILDLQAWTSGNA